MSVSLVIPGRNCAPTIGPCLEAALPLQAKGELAEIIFVDDGSTDDTRTIAAGYPVTVIAGTGRGAGAARNLGWRSAAGELIWFVDSDCVAEPEALARLMRHLDDPQVAAVGGSLTNATPQSLLACLVHEEIVERHLRMLPRVNFLATANVLYRRSVLEEAGGFDERFLKGQDAELARRVKAAGHELAFDATSRVAHHYYLEWGKYLRTQYQQGYWRVYLHLIHRGHAAGDSYSSALDHLQPPLALVAVASAPTLFVPYVRWLMPVLVAALALAQLPLTLRLVRRTRQWKHLAFAPMSMVRALWRGVGLVVGVCGWSLRRRET